MEDKIILTIDEVSELLGISRTNCYKLAAQPAFPAIRISKRRIIVPRQQLMEWLDNQAKNKN